MLLKCPHSEADYCIPRGSQHHRITNDSVHMRVNHQAPWKRATSSVDKRADCLMVQSREELLSASPLCLSASTSLSSPTWNHYRLLSTSNSEASMGFPGGSDGKESACHARDQGSIPGSGRSSEEGNGNPLQYSCLENSLDRWIWRATVHGVARSQIQLSDWHFHKIQPLIKGEVSSPGRLPRGLKLSSACLGLQFCLIQTPKLHSGSAMGFLSCASCLISFFSFSLSASISLSFSLSSNFSSFVSTWVHVSTKEDMYIL